MWNPFSVEELKVGGKILMDKYWYEMDVLKTNNRKLVNVVKIWVNKSSSISSAKSSSVLVLISITSDEIWFFK